MGVADTLDAYLHSVETYVSTVSVGSIQDTAQRIWNDITRYGGPSIESLPGIGSFSLPPPPPPLPPPEVSLASWATDNQLVLAGAGLGTALVIGIGIYAARIRRRGSAEPERTRRQVVIVLGADSDLGRQLVHDLERSGFIVIASVASPDAVFTSRAGYTRVLVLDPAQPDSLPAFIRSLTATLSIRFPTNSPGDPYLPPSSPHPPYIHSVVSLLGLEIPRPAPVEALGGYLEHIQRVHFTPLAVVQALLPLLRNTPGAAPQPPRWSRSIVLCTPLPNLAAAYHVTAASTKALNTALASALREELYVGGVRVLDVSLVNQAASGPTASSTMHTWSGSQRNVYGPQFTSTVQEQRRVLHALPPSSTTDLSAALVNSISRGRPPLPIPWWQMFNGVLCDWWRGDVFPLGSGGMLHFMIVLSRLTCSCSNNIFIGTLATACSS